MRNIPGVHDEKGYVTLYYDLDSNMISDKFGDIIYDIFQILSPNQLFLFKKKGGPSCFIKDKTNSYLVELVYV
jgi:hypothetical protein